MVRRIIIPIRELFQTQEEIRTSVEAVERAKQLIRDYEQSVCDLLSGEHGRRIKEMMEEIFGEHDTRQHPLDQLLACSP